MTNEEQRFIAELEAVSINIAVWAQSKIAGAGWTIEDVKVAIREAAKVCGRA